MSFATYKAINWALLRKTRKLLFATPFIVIGIAGLNLLSDSREGGVLDWWTVAWAALVVVLIPAFLVHRINQSLKKNYLNSPLLADGMRVTLTQEVIALQSASTTSETPWPASFKKATRLGRWLLLSSGPASAYFLNADGIEAPATPADLEALLRQKGVEIS